MVSKRYWWKYTVDTRRKKDVSITSWLVHIIIMNTLDWNNLLILITYVIIWFILWSRINVGCQCTHGLGEVHVVDWCSWRFGCEWPRILFYERMRRQKRFATKHMWHQLTLCFYHLLGLWSSTPFSGRSPHVSLTFIPFTSHLGYSSGGTLLKPGTPYSSGGPSWSPEPLILLEVLLKPGTP